MRIILSRKGFDSSAGGVASPILPDGRLLSLPIPVPYDDLLCFDDVCFDDANLGKVVEDLTDGAVKGSADVHLDPDLRREVRPREPGWLPAFGQSVSAARHLELQGVGIGDLFLFFGWFRQARETKAGLRFVPGAPDLHCLFGWLQVGSILKPGGDDEIPPWLSAHPHIGGHSAGAPHNLIYIASPKLKVDGLEPGWPGGGAFEHFAPALCLTQPGSRLRSHWSLPAWFNRKPRLSYHGNADRWSIGEGGVRLRTVGRGQEFVRDCGVSPEAARWICELFGSQGLSL